MSPVKKTAAKRAGRQKPENLRLRSASLSMTVNDLVRSMAWYRDVLGFMVGERWTDNGKLAGVSMTAGAVHILLVQDDFARGHDRSKGEGVRLYCETGQDVDELADRVRARGGLIAHEPEDRPWGVRDFGVVDPDGYRITIFRGN